MENTTVKIDSKKSGINKKFFISFFILVLFIISGGIYYFHIRKENRILGTTTTQVLKPSGALQRVQTPVPLSDRQKKQLVEGTSSSTEKKHFEITGGNYFFTPNQITVNQGDTVTIMFFNTFGIHNFVIDEFHVKTLVLAPGMVRAVTFTANKKGEYTFSSNLPLDLKQGMQGTLIVR